VGERRYTCGMDRVRFGRALGYGARHAAKTMLQAVDAATTPDPAPKAPRPSVPPAPTSAPPVESQRAGAQVAGAVNEVAEAYRKVHAAQTHVKREATKHAWSLRKSVLTPLKDFSSVVWLQVTGLFFGLFAMVLGGAVWRNREAFRLPVSDPGAQHAYFYLLVFVVFAYFTVSNFVRASRREKRR